MVTPPDIEAQILRYYHAEKWRVGTIARQLRVHHSVVRPGAGPGRAAADRAAAAALEDRPVSAIHPRDPGEVPDADRQPPARDGARARLSRRSRPLPPYHRLPPTASVGGGLSASAQPAWRTGSGRLGTFWPCGDRPGTPAADGFRHGAELLAPDLPALLPRRPHGELPARPCRRLRGMEAVFPVSFCTTI